METNRIKADDETNILKARFNYSQVEISGMVMELYPAMDCELPSISQKNLVNTFFLFLRNQRLITSRAC